MQSAVEFTDQNLGLAHRQLEALTAHGLNEHGQLQFTPPLDLPRVGTFGGQDPQ